MTLDEKRKKLEELALKHTSSQTEAYKNSIYLPYITLPNAKGKGTQTRRPEQKGTPRVPHR